MPTDSIQKDARPYNFLGEITAVPTPEVPDHPLINAGLPSLCGLPCDRTRPELSVELSVSNAYCFADQMAEQVAVVTETEVLRRYLVFLHCVMKR